MRVAYPGRIGIWFYVEESKPEKNPRREGANQ